MNLDIKASGEACGAEVVGVDLTKALTENEIIAIREAWF